MSLESRFIPLLFGDDDEDLWIALQSIDPEDRVRFIKRILRQGLNLMPDGVNTTGVQRVEHDSVLTQSDQESSDDAKPIPCDFTIEDLIINDSNPDSTEPLTKDTVDDSVAKSLNFLFNHIIGQEQNEEVIEAINAATLKRIEDINEPENDAQDPESTKESGNETMESVNDAKEIKEHSKEFADDLGINSIADLFIAEPNPPQVTNPSTLSGLNYLLTHVIGSEEDEEVINLLLKKTK